MAATNAKLWVVIESQSSEFNIRAGEQPNWFWITGLSQQHHLKRPHPATTSTTRTTMNKDANNRAPLDGVAAAAPPVRLDQPNVLGQHPAAVQRVAVVKNFNSVHPHTDGDGQYFN